MKVTADIAIDGSRDDVWSVITDIENWTSMITNIIRIRILNRPDDGIGGMEWLETRCMFGVEATETLQVTDLVENQYYCSRCERSDAVIKTKFSLSEHHGKTLLTISIGAEPQTSFSRTLSFCMGPIIKSAVMKELQQDLADIKKQVEVG